MSLSGRCPDEFYCSDGSHGYAAINATAPHVVHIYLGLLSATASMLGSLLILFAYCAFKDIRRGTAGKIITLLAVADVGTALSLLLGIANFLVYDHYRTDTRQQEDALCWKFDIVCQIQAYTTILVAISSYAWTSVLAVHFLVATVLRGPTWNEKLMPLYNVIAWILPIVVSLPLLVTGKLGYTPTYQATCFISADGAEQETSMLKLILETVVLWSTEVLCTVVIIVCYIIIFTYICCKVQNPCMRG